MKSVPPNLPSFSILIPVFNEERFITEVVRRVRKNLPQSQYSYEIIIINDGSTDDTQKQIDGLTGCLCLKHEKNFGKGRAVQTGLKASCGEIIVIQDADLEYLPSDIPLLLEPFRKKSTEVVYGVRIRRGGAYWFSIFFLGGKIIDYLFWLVFRVFVPDLSTGYKAFRKCCATSINLRENGFTFCAELTASFVRRSIPIKTVPVSYQPRGKKNGKKISFFDGLKVVAFIVGNLGKTQKDF